MDNLIEFDGMEALKKRIGGEDDFIKLAVEQSYFFSAEIVEARQQDVDRALKNQVPLPARKTQKTEKSNDYYQKEEDGRFYFYENNKHISEIVIDRDGNKEVRKLINDYTGYSVGAGKTSDFQNYNISHIWGRAFDPRYFTNFWNIVLIPAWANSLMDKKNPEKETLAAKLQATLVELCCKLYPHLTKNIKHRIDISKEDIIQTTYKINMFLRKEPENKKSKLYIKEITLNR